MSSIEAQVQKDQVAMKVDTMDTTMVDDSMVSMEEEARTTIEFAPQMKCGCLFSFINSRYCTLILKDFKWFGPTLFIKK